MPPQEHLLPFGTSLPQRSVLSRCCLTPSIRLYHTASLSLWLNQVLKAEKQNSDDKLEKLHAVLEKERNALREVLSAGPSHIIAI